MPKGNLPLAQENRNISNELDGLWDENAEKYKCCCRTVHVKKASLFIGYAQILLTFFAALFLAFYYLQAINGKLAAENWVNQMNERYFSSFLFAVSLQLFLTLLLVHGVRTERASFLLPFIIFASIAILLGIGQLAHDLLGFWEERYFRAYDYRQLVTHFIGLLIHVWCVAVIWRCYGFLGDKKVARQISNQLSTTHIAFHYGDIPYGYVAMPQPPPYADTVISADKQPLTIA